MKRFIKDNLAVNLNKNIVSRFRKKMFPVPVHKGGRLFPGVAPVTIYPAAAGNPVVTMRLAGYSNSGRQGSSGIKPCSFLGWRFPVGISDKKKIPGAGRQPHTLTEDGYRLLIELPYSRFTVTGISGKNTWYGDIGKRVEVGLQSRSYHHTNGRVFPDLLALMRRPHN
jgi:hypothetical protein